MELDRLTLQLIFNVVTVTVATSLALVCYLLNADNQRLAAELKRRNAQDRTGAESVTPAAASVPEPSSIVPEPVHVPELPAAVAAPPTAQQDIRQFVARRAQDWMLAQASKA
jgi:hypothetical protein